ncbi:PAS domain S-box protein [Ideonella sp. BN130291]|uniref:PAS domain S-box protein n=1 Tax=Ideonella sp. BN130291 TaxID=3112940 RepID=UPI002E2589EB|nr:PAS domain S-box protein [Ideonella sp. BN130291]
MSTTTADDARMQLLQSIGVLDSPPEASFDALVDCAAALTGCPMAVISLADSHRHWFKARRGVAITEAPRTLAFCEHTLQHDGVVEVHDARDDERFAHLPMVTQAPHVRFYAGVALALDGMALGTLCVMDMQPRELRPEQRAGLHSLAHAVSGLMHERRVQQALQNQSLRLHDLARASGDWMWELDEQLRYRWISGEFEAITGMPAQQQLGRSVPDEPRLDAQGRSQQRQLGGLHALLERRQPFARAITAKSTPQGTLYVSRSATPVFDANGQFRGWRGTARNVTSQIQAERETQLQHELLAKLSSQVPGVIFQYRVDAEGRGRFLYASEGVRALFGVEPPDQDGGSSMNSQVPLNLLHPDDVAGFRESIAEAVRELRPWTREYRIVRDGELRWLDTRAMPERLADGSTLFHGFTADITERKQTELALRETEARWDRAADAAGIGLVEYDVTHCRLSFDRRACMVHGLAYPHPPLPLADWLEMVHEEDRPRVHLGLERAQRPGGHTEGRVRVLGADGTWRHLELASDARTDAMGRVTALLGTCRDISDHIAHERLRRDKEAAERANQAKSQFLSRVSHELRTPLNSILGFAQLMALDAEQPLAPEQQRRLAGVQRAGSHLLDLIDEVLDLTRIERQEFHLPLQAVDLSQAVRSCLRVLQPQGERQGISLPGAPTEPCWVQADGRALEQVLMNLLSNAIKYNRPGGAVRLALARDALHVQVSVIDEGEGLDAHQQAQLFQPFNRLGAERRRVEGTGLGLVIARELTLAMEGRLEVQSTPGRGSRFTVVLWAADGSGASPVDTVPSALDALPAGRDCARRSVLYIEDEPLNVVLMEEVFRTRPAWTLQVAVDGARGLHLARTLKPHLLLIDMNLPDMGGLQVIRELRAHPATAGLRCIAFSADAMREQIDAAMAAGFDAYWTKPIDLRRMLDLLSEELA